MTKLDRQMHTYHIEFFNLVLTFSMYDKQRFILIGGNKDEKGRVWKCFSSRIII